MQINHLFLAIVSLLSFISYSQALVVVQFGDGIANNADTRVNIVLGALRCSESTHPLGFKHGRCEYPYLYTVSPSFPNSQKLDFNVLSSDTDVTIDGQVDTNKELKNPSNSSTYTFYTKFKLTPQTTTIPLDQKTSLKIQVVKIEDLSLKINDSDNVYLIKFDVKFY